MGDKQAHAGLHTEFETSMTTVVPLQRALRVLSPWYNTKVDWMQEATPLERVGLARIDSEGLAQLSTRPISSLEALAGATNANPERQKELLALVGAQRPSMSPAYLNFVMSDEWSLGVDSDWKNSPPQTQLLMVRYAALTKHFLRGKTSGDVSTWDTMELYNTFGSDIKTDSMVQSIIAANNPALFGLMLRSDIAIDKQAQVIGYLNGQTLQRADYDTMDDTMFVGLIAYDKTQYRGGDALSRVLDENRTLHRYPWDKLPLILEHNPARFLKSVLTNPEVANAQNHVKRWFIPMLDASIERAAKDPEYAHELLSTIFSTGGRKNFEKTMVRHAPSAYEALNVARQLYDKDQSGSDEPALRGWFQLQASKSSPTELLDLNTALFSHTPLGAP